MLGILGLSVSLSSFAADTTTWYVSVTNGNDTTGSGTEASPYASIQKAIDEAKADDTILVDAGVYATGEKTGQSKSAFNQRTRVVVDKRLTIKSQEGRDRTFIVGEIGDGIADTDGTKTVQCIWITDAAAGSVVEGFTLRDGAACSGKNGVMAGAISSSGKAVDYTLAFCKVTNCVGKYGAMRFGTAVGTLFIGNGHAGDTGINACNAYESRLFNCILASGVSSSFSAYNCGPIVNCTIVNHLQGRGARLKDSTVVVEGGCGYYYNSAIYGNFTANDDANAVIARCFWDHQTVGNQSDGSMAVKKEAFYSTNLVMSAATGDFRPVKDGRLDGAGNRAYLDLIPEAYRNLDFNGKPLAENAPIPIGAILPAAKANAGIYFPNPVRIDGKDIAATFQCHYVTNWPTQAYIEAHPDEISSFVGVTVGEYAGCSKYNVVCGKYSGLWLTLSPTEDENGNPLPILSVSRVAVDPSRELYVNCEYDGSKGASDGTEDRPYVTIQNALDTLSEKSYAYRIHVARGVYKTGGGVDLNSGTSQFNARIVLPKERTVVIVATEGPEVTFIEGQPDPGTLDVTDGIPGCGPKAYRCVSASSSTCYASFVGFTFREGYSSNAGNPATGGAVRGNGYCVPQFYDCVFTSNHAVNASCLYYGCAIRCQFVGNESTSVGVVGSAFVQGCIFTGNNSLEDSSADYRVLYSETVAANISVYEPNAPAVAMFCSGQARMINSVVAAAGTMNVPGDGGLSGNVIHDVKAKSGTYTDEQARFVNPLLASPARGDWRPAVGSPVFGGGMSSAEGVGLGDMMRYIAGDYDNRPVLTADGRVNIGAVTTARVPQAIYADAVKGNDANDGLTEATAKKTLQSAIEDAACGGDTVVALKGIYASGSMGYVNQPGYVVAASHPASLRARVTVPDGMTLESKFGPEETIIEGAAQDESEDEHGRGPNALRCVFLEKNAVLRGFTIRNGRTDTKDHVGRYDDSMGGGVLGRGHEYSTVENCIVKDNAAAYGGGISMVTAKGCVFTGNWCESAGVCAEKSAVANSYFNDNTGPYLVTVPKTVENCSFGGNNKSGTGNNIAFPFYDCNGETHLRNILFLSKLRSTVVTWASTAAEVSGFVAPKEALMEFPVGATGIYTNEYTYTEMCRLFDETCHPLMKTAPTMDRGFDVALVGATDLDGGQRVMNGTIDIGCYEFDWRGEYAKSMGKSGVTVVEVTPGVVLTDGHAVMSDGDALALDCPAGKVGVAKLVLTGTGTVKVYLNGALIGTLTESGEQKVVSELDVDRLTFAYEGTGSAYVAKLSGGLGMLMIVR